MSTVTKPPQPAQSSIGRSAFLVAAGIFLSRLAGLVRDRVFAHYFGNSFAADAFRAALRIPNFLQNLFGEGVLSASFIPVYAKLVAEREDEEAGRVAGAVFSLLALVTSVLVLSGVLATPYLIDAIAPGFKGDTRLLTIQLVRVLFPGVGLLVLSAWCLGILNSHRKFFLSYVSPVVWNIAIIVALLAFGRGATRAEGAAMTARLSRLAIYTAWGSVIGSAVQFLMQLPIVLRLVPTLHFGITSLTGSVRTVIRNFGPVFLSRGVVQLSAYVDAAKKDRFQYRADRVFRCSVGGGISCPWRCDRRCYLPDRTVHPRRCGLCVGDPRGVGRRIGRFNGRALVLVGILRIARYSHAAAFCRGARRTHHWAGILVCAAGAARIGNRLEVGCRRTDGVGRIFGVDRISAVAARHGTAHR
jgi:hypothetical protein